MSNCSRITVAALVCAILHFAAARVCAAEPATNPSTQPGRDVPARIAASGRKGYVARPCGFDMNRNGRLGEPADRLVGDGKTIDPDGDGVNEDILYVDSSTGSDEAGDGSAAKPYKTIQKALDACDGPEDGAEDIVCISGTFKETLTIRKSGVAGHYVRDGFQFPNNPLMIIGWDKDGDGEYPPYDKDDVAVLEGDLGGGKHLPWAIRCSGRPGPSYLEIAHLTIRNYGYQPQDCGALRMFTNGGEPQTHIYIHDVEMHQINKSQASQSGRIVFSWWGGPRSHVAFINNLVNEYGSYFCRGTGRGERYRFQSNTIRMYGVPVKGLVSGWKIWHLNEGFEILDNILDANPAAYNTKSVYAGVGICQCTRGWTIRGNEFRNTGIVLQAHAGEYCTQRSIDDVVIDRNVFRYDYPDFRWPPIAISIGQCTDLNNTILNVTITNNFISTGTEQGMQAAIRADVGNSEGPQPGAITIAGNTMNGPFTRNGNAAVWIGGYPRREPHAHLQENITFKNNIIANARDNPVVRTMYAPKNWVANGNVYDGSTGWVWNGVKCDTLEEWQAATGQDADSRTGNPAFVDAAAGDLHLAPEDTVARTAGVDISKITKVDLDGDPRPTKKLPAGADVPRPRPTSAPSKR